MCDIVDVLGTGHVKMEVQIELSGSQVGRAGVESRPRPGEDGGGELGR